MTYDNWTIFGFMGQTIFMSRFLVQWLSSEKQGRSVVPLQFWYLSLCGGAVLAIYAIQRQDPVFISGQCLGLIVYVRNLQLIRAERLRNQQQTIAETSAPDSATETPS